MDEHSQLQALLDYYNRKEMSLREKQPIDWDEAKDGIHTAGVVDKMQEQYEAFMETEYSVDQAAERALSKSEKLKMLDIKNDYNFEVWWYNFQKNLRFLETIRNLGDVTQISLKEMCDYQETNLAMGNGELETGNINLQFVGEDNLADRTVTQFAWSAKIDTPFEHSAEVSTAVGTTLGKLGR